MRICSPESFHSGKSSFWKQMRCCLPAVACSSLKMWYQGGAAVLSSAFLQFCFLKCVPSGLASVNILMNVDHYHWITLMQANKRPWVDLKASFKRVLAVVCVCLLPVHVYYKSNASSKQSCPEQQVKLSAVTGSWYQIGAQDPQTPEAKVAVS